MFLELDFIIAEYHPYQVEDDEGNVVVQHFKKTKKAAN